jgi:hypothetical protein
MTYSVFCENELPPEMPETGAPVQIALITDAIDPDLDIASLELDPMIIGSGEPFAPSPLLPSITSGATFESVQVVSVSNVLGVFDVEVRVTLDLLARLVTWRFETLGLPPTAAGDALGFLPPPSDTTPEIESEASVSFTVNASDAAEPGTEVSNEAHITFDDNFAATITTNEVLHVVVGPPGAPANPSPPDRTEPPVPAVVNGAALELAWSAAEGAVTYDVYLWPAGAAETLVASGVALPKLTPPELDLLTEYRWRVVAVNVAGVTSGPEWRFRTAGGVRFVRGDVDASGRINITDAIFLLDWLFQGGPRPPCVDAADVDDDGGQRPAITDAIALLLWLFQGGRPPMPPGPTQATYALADCGIDTTSGPPERPDAMDCAAFPPCP